MPENGNAGVGNIPVSRNDESVKPAKPRILKQLKSPKDRGKLRDAYEKIARGPHSTVDELMHVPPIGKKPTRSMRPGWRLTGNRPGGKP